MGTSSDSGLTLVIGPANSGKKGLVLDWWQQRLAQKPLVVAPTGPDAAELSVEMAGRTGGLVGHDQGLTFDGLVRRVLGRPPRYASDLERALVAARLLRDTRLEALASAARLPGVTTALAELLERLGESGRDPEDLDHLLARWASSDPRAAPLAGDIRRLARARGRAYAALGLIDRPSAVREATLAAGSWTRPVALYGFTSFTAGQRALVEALSHRAEVLVAFTHDRSRAVNLSTPGEIAWWQARAERVEEVAPPGRAYASAAVAYLERHFMSAGERPPAPPACSEGGGVGFLLASGQRAEAELAAEKIVRLIRAGERPGDIAVVVRRVRAWAGLLGHVFDSCGIPHQIDDRRPLRETGLGHAFLRALRGVVLDDAAALLAYLRSPYSGLSLEEVSNLELNYRRGTARGARILAGMATSAGVPSVQRLWSLVGGGALGSASTPGAALRFAPAAADSLVRHMLTAGSRGSPVGDRSTEEDARAFRALRAAFKTIGFLGSAQTGDGESRDGGPVRGVGAAPGDGAAPRVVTPADPRGWLDPQLLLRSLGQVAVPGSRMEDENAVQILSVQRARARRFQVVLMLGLVEGEFPGRPDTPSLLSAAQRARLDEVGGGLLPPEVDQEAAFFVSAISRPWRLLLLSARDAEDDGSASMPSHYWQAAKELLGVGESEHDHRTLAEQVFAPGEAPSLQHYLRACAACGRTPDAAVVSASGAAVRGWGRPPSRLRDPAVLDELARLECFSPSALEAYAGCPFRWFVERVIGAEDLDLELDGRVIGQLLHSVLSSTYSRLSSAGLLPLREADLPVAEQQAAKVIAEAVTGDQCPGTPSERRLATWRLTRMARNLFDMEVSAGGSLVLWQTEMWVGGSRGVDVGGLRIRGRIDRVDSAADGETLFVLDYKTGAIPSSAALGTGEGLQLPLYLLALGAERPRARVAGGAYLALSDKKRCGVVADGSEGVLGSGTRDIKVLDQAALDELCRKTRETALDAAEGMRAGRIAPPEDRPCPTWCELGQACRARRGDYRP